ncbi:hypothetical protein BDD12DRAFT_873556 [Trichophaea hybrida]|nr:hypothetical protein BDD12DRAFT_873556 [Trichophaea hybrida]
MRGKWAKIDAKVKGERAKNNTAYLYTRKITGDTASSDADDDSQTIIALKRNRMVEGTTNAVILVKSFLKVPNLAEWEELNQELGDGPPGVSTGRAEDAGSGSDIEDTIGASSSFSTEGDNDTE